MEGFTSCRGHGWLHFLWGMWMVSLPVGGEDGFTSCRVNKIIFILRRSMLSIGLDRPGKHVLIFPRVVTMPNLCNHSVRHPLHSGSVLTSVPVSHIHWPPIQILTLLRVA